MADKDNDLAERMIAFLQSETDKEEKPKDKKSPSGNGHDKEDISKQLKEIRKPVSKKQILLCHIMHNKNNEIGVVRTKLYAQEFQWRGRIYPIDNNAIWFDKKGIGHIHVDMNMSDGTIRFLYQEQLNLINIEGEECQTCHKLPPLDMCGKCGDRISIDAKNVRDLIKRKTLTTFWGIDQSHIVLLLIMGVIAIGAFGGLMYLMGENQKVQKNYTDLLNKQLAEKEGQIPQFILPMVITK